MGFLNSFHFHLSHREVGSCFVMHLSIVGLAIAACCSRAHATPSLVARQDERPIDDPDLESFDRRADISGTCPALARDDLWKTG